VLDAHTEAITKFQWFENSRYLFTSSKDKYIRVWEIPKTWIREDIGAGTSPEQLEPVEEEVEDLETSER
jgi:WD40 repeat protein